MAKDRVELRDIKQHHRITVGKVFLEIILALIVVLGVIPLLWVMFMSVKSQNEIFLNPLGLPQQIQWVNYENAFKKIPFLLMLKNSAIELILTIPASLFLGFLSSFALARITVGKANHLIFLYYIAGIIVPGFVLIFPLYMIMNWVGLYDTILSLALIHIAWSAPMNTMILTSMMRSIPLSLDEAAAIDGCTVWQIMWKIYRPIVKPSLMTLLILGFLGVWNDYALAKVFLQTRANYTIPLASALFKGLYSTDYALMTAGIVILTLPEVAVFAALQKHIIGGIMEGAVKG